MNAMSVPFEFEPPATASARAAGHLRGKVTVASKGLAPGGLALVPLQQLEECLASIEPLKSSGAEEGNGDCPTPTTAAAITAYIHQQLPMPPATLPPSPPHDERSVSPVSADSSSRASSTQDPVCRWGACSRIFPDAEALYAHLCADHVGRKSTGNLCLTCRWTNCTISCAKRDHITSHLRVHTPLKPHICEVCSKSFKRPQDLKKHEKIHTEEHHAQHKHSKAITVNDPDYVQRVRRQPPQSALGQGPFLPTPSPELDSIDLALPDMPHMHWTPTPMAGTKRSRTDYAVDEFLSDVKKRCVQPAYDSHMIERLNHIVHIPQQQQQHIPQQQHHHHIHQPQQQQQHPSFNPTSISLDIRSEAELAALNQFLLTLGRDVSSGLSTQDLSTYGVDYTPGPSPDDYFSAESLQALGLAGLPGMPDYPSSTPSYALPPHGHGSTPSYSAPAAARAMPQQQQHMYPAMGDLQAYPPSIRTSGSHMRPHYPSANGLIAMPGSASSSNTASPSSQYHNPDSFGGVRPTRGLPPTVHLAPQTSFSHAYRSNPLLQSTPSQTPPPPVEPALKPAQQRGLPGILPSIADARPPAYAGPNDPALTLPPIRSGGSTRLPSFSSMVGGGASAVQRAQHAKLIRDLLVRVNAPYRKRYLDVESDSDSEEDDEDDGGPGTSSSSGSGTVSPRSERGWTLSPRAPHVEVGRPRDVEMIAV